MSSPVQQPTPNAALRAALYAAKDARLPDHIEAQVARIGVMPSRPKAGKAPRPMWTGPTKDQPECPF